MSGYSRYTFVALLSMGAACALAQETPAQQDETAPSAASSPHQRQTTTTQAAEAPANQDTQPSSSSSQHQRQATQTGEKGTGGEKNVAQHDRMMKDCMSKQQENDSAMTKDQAKKACADQMKSKQNTRG